MRFRVVTAFILILSCVALAAPTTKPADKSNTKYPSPAELYAKIKHNQEKQDALLKVAYFDLGQSITEKPGDFSFFAPGRGTTLQVLLDRIEAARDDGNVKALFIKLTDASVELAQAQEIRDQLKTVAAAGKKVFTFAEGYDTTSYTIASGATDICLLPGGEIMVPGVGLSTMFYKGAMDKVGIKADYIQIGEFKGAEEPYTRTTPSDELRGELTRLTDAMFEQIIDGIAANRKVSREAVQQMIDETMMTSDTAKSRGFVDHLIDEDEVHDLIKTAIGGDIAMVRDYGAPKQEEVDFSNPFMLLAALAKKPEPAEKPVVAIIYADGTIVDGSGAASLFDGGGVGSGPMRKNFRNALNDDNVKAVVLRIDSPGGSALASEVMWQSARRLAAKKPLIVSVGGMAASGGYYLASAGDYIFADPIGIVGSIGVVGGKFVTKDLYDKLGLSTETFSKGRNAGLFNSNEPWTDQQKELVRNWMKRTYDQFTQRVMTTRTGKIADIDKVARGRIFLAQQAKELGMVDEIGGTQAAIRFAAKTANLSAGDYEVRALPGAKSIGEFLGMGGGDEDDVRSPLAIRINADSILQHLSPQVRGELSRQVQMMQILEHRPIMLMSPFVVSVR